MIPETIQKKEDIRYTHLSDSDDSVIYYTYLLIFLAIEQVYTSNNIHGMTPINVANIYTHISISVVPQK